MTRFRPPRKDKMKDSKAICITLEKKVIDHFKAEAAYSDPKLTYQELIRQVLEEYMENKGMLNYLLEKISKIEKHLGLEEPNSEEIEL